MTPGCQQVVLASLPCVVNLKHRVEIMMSQTDSLGGIQCTPTQWGHLHNTHTPLYQLQDYVWPNQQKRFLLSMPRWHFPLDLSFLGCPARTATTSISSQLNPGTVIAPHPPKPRSLVIKVFSLRRKKIVISYISSAPVGAEHSPPES